LFVGVKIEVSFLGRFISNLLSLKRKHNYVDITQSSTIFTQAKM